MPSPTVENYVKEIFLAQQRLGSASVPMGAVAKAMDVTPGTATAMLKSLAQSGLAEYEPRKGARLSDKGRRLALKMIRKHRIIELFLVEQLGLDWGAVHKEAERMEHAISEVVLACMDNKLGHPTHDPHGDPIPSEDGDLEESILCTLADCNCGKNYAIARVGDQSADFLQYLDERGLKPGASLNVSSRNTVSDAVTLSTSDGRTVTMGMKAAEKIFVQTEG
ncbi:MAG: metal-dependent transcriptional regulator [Opitutales bacterium]|nr:metal-dependent transcriptional regulator [Opitutales bacterium]